MCYQCRLYLFFALLVIPFYHAESAPLDLFLSAKKLDSSPKKFSIQTGYDFTNDTVSYSPNLTEGGYADPIEAKRYEGGHFLGTAQINSNWIFEGALWKRQVFSMRDQYDITSSSGALQYNLPFSWNGYQFALRTSIWNNFADTLDKNSYTRYQGYLFTSAKVHEPEDLQTQVNFVVSRDFKRRLSASLFTGVGQSKVGFSWLEGEARTNNNCQYRFVLLEGYGQVDQLGQCGNVKKMKIKLPSKEAIVTNIGFDPNEDLQYDSIYWQIGGNILWSNKRWIFSLGYYFQEYDRRRLDARIKQLGHTTHTTNHTAGFDLSYALSKHTTIYFRSEYMSNRLINLVPFAYNSYTAEKFGKDGLLYSGGLKLSL